MMYPLHVQLINFENSVNMQNQRRILMNFAEINNNGQEIQFFITKEQLLDNFGHLEDLEIDSEWLLELENVVDEILGVVYVGLVKAQPATPENLKLLNYAEVKEQTGEATDLNSDYISSDYIPGDSALQEFMNNSATASKVIPQTKLSDKRRDNRRFDISGLSEHQEKTEDPIKKLGDKSNIQQQNQDSEETEDNSTVSDMDNEDDFNDAAAGEAGLVM